MCHRDSSFKPVNNFASLWWWSTSVRSLHVHERIYFGGWLYLSVVVILDVSVVAYSEMIHQCCVYEIKPSAIYVIYDAFCVIAGVLVLFMTHFICRTAKTLACVTFPSEMLHTPKPPNVQNVPNM